MRNPLALFLAALFILLAGCVAPGPERTPDAKRQLLWPRPPDQPRFVFEGLLRSAADILVETDEMRVQRMLTGRRISDKPVIDKPAGIAVRGGLVYVAEPSAKAITVFDLQRRRLFRFGLRKPNSLERPQAIAVDTAGLVYVLDSALRKVMVFDDLGLFKYAIDLGRSFTHPVAVAVNPDGSLIYVVDRGDVGNADHKVVAYTPDGSERYRIGSRGEEAGQFNIPLAAAVGTDGTLYVADAGNFRIQALDRRGQYRFSFGGPGLETGRFSRPRGIALDGEGNIYVSDAGFNNVQIFDADGRLLMPLGRLSSEAGPGNYSLIAGIAVDETNRLYIVDHFFKKIDVFRRLGDEEARRLATTP